MAEVLSPPVALASSPSVPSTREPESSSEPVASLSPNPRTLQRDRVPIHGQHRISQASQQSSRSRPSSHVFPAFASSLSYALVRDFAYPVFHPMHYGAEPEPSGTSTPSSEWNPARRQSDPMEQWNGTASGNSGGWSAGPWGGDGVLFDASGRSLQEGESLPSTSFGSEGPLDLGDDDMNFRRSRHRKSKSYTSISDYERGRRRESGRGRDTADGIFIFHGQQSDPAGRDSLRLSRGYSGAGNENGGARRDSPFASTLPNRSFNSTTSQPNPFDPDEQIPLDTEPHASPSPVRDSLGPEDEDLFAGLSLALYSFEPENSNELRLVEGQEILVSYRHGQGWLVASDPRTGEQGLVPEAYVRLIADIPAYDPETGQFVEVEEAGDDDDDDDDDEEEDEEGDSEKSEGLELEIRHSPSALHEPDDGQGEGKG